MSSNYLPCDYRSLKMHKIVAERIKKNPALLEIAFNNIKKWKERNKFPQPYLDDWIEHINLGVEHLCEFLSSETDEAQRLRSSSPFVGIVTQKERREIFKEFQFEKR